MALTQGGTPSRGTLSAQNSASWHTGVLGAQGLGEGTIRAVHEGLPELFQDGHAWPPLLWVPV